ncbi:PRD domain-containing protein [Tumebacillus sp. ITR2]|uniref:PRD domain-containing protein n=1 Tax=Tumebacillus amylolyticus TaxID=2801339 RepID=A0ABS1J576_9BACL|nr:PRD domain-containing protein [Tumebacillus amylolyticus]
MLDSRKQELLHTLLQAEGYLSVDDLSQTLHVSEKTIRNDLKILDEWLQHYPDVQIIRKPSVGVYLAADPEVKKEIRRAVKPHPPEPQTRKLQLAKWMLEYDNVCTMQLLADTFYVSKSTINLELGDVEAWLARFHLDLVRKPNYGLRLTGGERDWRCALVETTRLLLERELPNLRTHPDLRFYESKVRELESAMEFRFTDHAILTLTLQFEITGKRIQQKKPVELSPDELSHLQAKREFALIRRMFPALEDSEIGYLTLQVLGAKVRVDEDVPSEQVEQVLQQINPESLVLARQMIREMARFLEPALLHDEELLSGLSLHLHSALHRLRYGRIEENPLIHEIKSLYRHTFEAMYAVTQELETEIGAPVPEDEVGFLTLHFQAALVRNQQTQPEPKRVLIVCSTGTGTAKLIQSKLRQHFPTLDIVKTTSAFDLQGDVETYNPHVLLSTIPLPSSSVPTLTVSPLLTPAEMRRIEQFLDQLQTDSATPQSSSTVLKSYLTEELTFLDVEGDRLSILGWLADQLHARGYVTAEYKESAVKRELLSSTAIGGEIAIPHGPLPCIRKPGIAVARLSKLIDWGGEKVRFVFMLAVPPVDPEQTKRLFQDLTALVDDTERRRELQQRLTATDFLHQL